MALMRRQYLAGQSRLAEEAEGNPRQDGVSKVSKALWTPGTITLADQY